MMRLALATLGAALFACGDDPWPGTPGTTSDTLSPSPDVAGPGVDDDLGPPLNYCGDCDDGDPCTFDDCIMDACEHYPALGYCHLPDGSCLLEGSQQPGNPCVVCFASIGGGSDWVPAPASNPCDDGDACTTDDRCDEGSCAGGAALDCGTEDPCLSGSCDPGSGCQYDPQPGAPCDDGDVCTEGDSCDADANCTPGAAVVCDDEDPCTADTCHPTAGCLYEAGVCDDGDPCTADSCAADGACSNAPFEGPCEDGDLCTVGEVCDAGGVCGGGAPLDCDDGSSCTDDACHPSVGCYYEFLTDPCDDGFECTLEDTCVAGICVGSKTGCEDCPVPVSDHAAKVTVLEVGTDGKPGSGLDVDGDPTTCQPEGDCSGGVDNVLGLLASILNEGITTSLDAGTLTYVVDLADAKVDGTPFDIAVHFADLSSTNLDCAIQTEPCEWKVAQALMDPSCTPYWVMQDATIVDGQLSAGGKDTTITLVLPITAEFSLPLTIAWARFEAAVTVAADGETIEALSGLLAGAVPKQQLLDAIEKVPADLLPFDKDALVPLLDTLIVNDIDLDSNAIYESVSIGLSLATIPAVLVEPPEVPPDMP